MRRRTLVLGLLASALVVLVLGVSPERSNDTSGAALRVDTDEGSDSGLPGSRELAQPDRRTAVSEATRTKEADDGASGALHPTEDTSAGDPRFDWRIGDQNFSELVLESMEYEELQEVVDALRDEQARTNEEFIRSQPWEPFWIPNSEWGPEEPYRSVDPDIYLMQRRGHPIDGELGMVFVPRGLAPEMYALKDAHLEVLATSAWRAQRELEYAEFRASQTERFPDRDLVFEKTPNGVAFRVYEGRIGGPLLNQRTYNIDNW